MQTQAGTPKALVIAYWVSTVLVTLNWSFGGISSLLHLPASMEVFHRLGYPPYFPALLGTAQLLGVLALWAPVPRTVREWAYAGLTFDVIAAMVSLAAIGSPAAHFVFPVLALGVLLISHRTWHRRMSVRTSVGESLGEVPA